MLFCMLQKAQSPVHARCVMIDFHSVKDLISRHEDAHIAEMFTDIYTGDRKYVHKNSSFSVGDPSLARTNRRTHDTGKQRSCTLPAETLIFLRDERTVYTMSNSLWETQQAHLPFSIPLFYHATTGFPQVQPRCFEGKKISFPL